MIRLTPPVAPPVTLSQLASSLLARGPQPHSGFERTIADFSGSRAASLYGSGRSALAALLGMWKQKSPRDEVLVPAYTCWSIPASVVRSGLRVRLADVDPMSFDFDPEGLESVPTGGLLAVVAPHLLAPSCDVLQVRRQFASRDAAVRLVEDAAQAWPDRAPDRGHAVLLSFGRGKPLALGGGGAVLHDGIEPLSGGPASVGGWRLAAAFLATLTLARPRVYRLPESLPFLHLGETVYDLGYDDRIPFYAWQDRLGVRLLERLPALIRARTSNARRLCERIAGGTGWKLPSPAFAAGPLRLPILAPSREARDRAVLALRRAGVSASPLYPGTLADVPALRLHLANPDANFPGARLIAERLVTLPVYPGLDGSELDRIATAFERAVLAGR